MDVDINKIKNIDPVRISQVTGIEPIEIDRLSNIAPLAAHIKEVNHIDPISVDALHVSEVKNIEPINIDRFNVTDLPTVNLSVRQLPAVDMNIRQLPAVSLGTYQTFSLPSNYTVRASFLGIEFLRVYLSGCTGMLPKERYRREQARTQNQSFPLPATAGNLAIPSTCRETSARGYAPPAPCPAPPPAFAHGYERQGVAHSPTPMANYGPPDQVHIGSPAGRASFHAGPPAMDFRIADASEPGTWPPSSVRSGG